MDPNPNPNPNPLPLTKVKMEAKALNKSATSSSFRKLHCPSLNKVRLRRIFDLFDKNHDGFITIDELCQAFHCLGWEADPSEIEAMIGSYIKPGGIGLEYDEFEAFHGALNEALFGGNDDVGKDKEKELSDLREAFKVFDENGDGFISAKELQRVLGKIGLAKEGVEMERVERMISSVDRNRDGRVDFSEFRDMMTVISPS